MTQNIVILFFIPPVLAIIYRWLEQVGVIDKLTGRSLAIDGLKRLKSTSGYPKSWIFYNEDGDKRIFIQLEKRISKKTRMPKIQQIIKQGHKPKLISTAGKAIAICGLPPDWPQDERYSYLPNQPILYVFDAPGTKGQKGDKVCTLEEFEKWLQEEKDSRLYWLGVIALGVVSIALLVLRLSIEA
ncbi:MAG: hypothetical protein VSS75_006935 [Candidatus Parabeggiatoa sp.]|nr:hypothetical protein [Candidatus Parabeggiatoa sp.]